MNTQSRLNYTITDFFNSIIMIKENVDGDLFDEIINLNYNSNSFNETVFIETRNSYFIVYYIEGEFYGITEHEKNNYYGDAE